MKILLILLVISWVVEHLSTNYIYNNLEEKIRYSMNIPTVARSYKHN
jgi:hypothetical protein